MEESVFTFKQFTLTQNLASLKLGTDAVILGASTEFSNPKSILDIGTGTGILALMMAQKYNCKITAIDIEKGAFENSQQNFIQSPWSKNVTSEHISLEDFTKKQTEKFDGIICNPPFFSKSLLSENTNKNIARHTITLTPENLFQNISRLLSVNGKCAIIIPYSEKQIFVEASIVNQLYVIEEVEISPFYNSPANRLILIFSRTWNPLIKKTISIRETPLEYSKEYKELTKEFYIHL